MCEQDLLGIVALQREAAQLRSQIEVVNARRAWLEVRIRELRGAGQEWLEEYEALRDGKHVYLKPCILELEHDAVEVGLGGGPTLAVFHRHRLHACPVDARHNAVLFVRAWEAAHQAEAASNE